MSLGDSSDPHMHPKRPRFPHFCHVMTRFQTVCPKKSAAHPPHSPASWHVSSHWPHSERSHGNTGLAHGRYLFPGFPSGLTPICVQRGSSKAHLTHVIFCSETARAPHCSPGQVQQRPLSPHLSYCNAASDAEGDASV